MKKWTGERVLTAEGGFNPTWQRHVAAYALADSLLPQGRLLDVGCGIGHSYHLLAPRETVGLDISSDALEGQDRETHVADMRDLPFDDHSFASVLSVQSLEHVPDPERVIAEVARVLEPTGTAVFVTPNRYTLGRPDEIIDPYHFREFDHAELAEACRERFEKVRVVGLFGSPRYMEIVDEERAKLERMLAKDPLRLRRLVPVRAKQWLYDAVLLRNRDKPDPRAEAIEVDDFELRDTDLLEALDVIAICEGPLATAGDHPRATECVWCKAPFDGRVTHLGHRTRCSACGAATTDPPPSDDELAEAYGDWYRPHEERRFYFAADAILGRSRALLAARIDEITPPGPVLDVGAGDGTLIDALRDRGREATGLERNPARDDLRDEPLSEVKGEWAAVVFWHSLEHLPDPGEAIRQAARLLLPRGVLIVAVPNNDSLQAQAFGDRWLHLDLPRHLVHLTTRSLRSGLRREGFRVERVSYLRAGQILIGWLQGLVGMLPGQPDLYQALRRERARGVHQSLGKRIVAIAAAVLLTPVAAAAAAVEIATRRAGTVYIEARLG